MISANRSMIQKKRIKKFFKKYAMNVPITVMYYSGIQMMAMGNARKNAIWFYHYNFLTYTNTFCVFIIL